MVAVTAGPSPLRAASTGGSSGRMLSAGRKQADWCPALPRIVIEFGHLLAADIHDVAAARNERAAAGQVQQARRLTGNRLQPLTRRSPLRESMRAGRPCRDGAGRRRCRAGRRSRRSDRRTSRTPCRPCSAITPRSWVIMMIAVPNSCCSRAMTSSTWACTVTSRAVVGSSAMSSLGLSDIAIAIIARCRMPPENWCG